ncbi:polyhydroxyalkanoate synthesis regulator DNA-binding domain-containing protein [Legionella dresdenensis]|uniref:Polyhydroxyalkanoate synthesis regulator DNA-binding domain-containing protein n=1 Tax=Legionella dresdenensis TaxID=450200 RepID=A0ABV8CFQ1_9GAMM
MKPRLIKKYKNRRLYDTEISQYITVEELQRYVLEQIPFRVEDAATEADITSATLLQIFVDMENGPSKFFTADMLRQLIIAAHHPMHQAFKSGLEGLFNMMEKSTHTNPYKQATDAWQQQMDTITKQWQNLFKFK